MATQAKWYWADSKDEGKSFSVASEHQLNDAVLPQSAKIQMSKNIDLSGDADLRLSSRTVDPVSELPNKVAESSGVDRDHLPPIFERVIVFCKGFRCLGYVDEKGVWKDDFQSKKIDVVGWEEVGGPRLRRP